MKRIEDILDVLQSNHPGADIELVRRAYVYSAKAHKGQLRADRRPYLSHPIEVAGILADLRMDEMVITAGLLHDTVEDTTTTIETVNELFGGEVAALVDGVTKISGVIFQSTEDKQAENYRKFILAMSQDIRVILIKLADRLHNMRTLEFLPEEKRRLIARETMDIYAPLAHRLGIAALRWELEDLAFRYLQPEEYREIEQEVSMHRSDRERFIDRVAEEVRGMLVEHSIEAEVAGRPKHFYSIWEKMQRRGIPFREVYDLIALRVITGSIQGCYAVLGAIHTRWKPVPGRFKDYIALPKPNLYQSIHTTVSVPGGEMIEFQIRTREMHRVAEMGIAAHWAYKEGANPTPEYLEQFTWLRRMLEMQEEVTDSKEFLKSLKVDLFPNEIYVFTPKGDVITLSGGATTIDFAFAIHTQVGLHCQQAKVNGRLVPLKTVLRSGDRVEVITSPTREPSRDWLTMARSSKARSKIRAHIKTKEIEKSQTLGRGIIESLARKHGYSMTRLEKEGLLAKAMNEFGFRTPDAFFTAIGYGKVTGQQAMGRMIPRQQETKPVDGAARAAGKKEGISLRGLEGMMVSYARCCNPLPGDPIIGFVTRGRGVTIHTRGCPNIERLLLDPERALPVEWPEETESLRTAYLGVECLNRHGILAAQTAAMTAAGGDIVKAVAEVRGQVGYNRFAVMVRDLAGLDRIIAALRQVKGVTSVTRLRTYRPD